MWRHAVLLAVTVVLCACQKSAPEAARQELSDDGIPVTPQAAVEAARKGDLPRITLLREAGLDLALPNEEGETPLLAALAAGHADVVDNLVRGGVVMTSLPPSPEPGQATDAATRKVLESAARSLPEPADAQSALAWALARRDTDTLRLLLEHGADPNQPLKTPASEDFVKTVGDETFAYYLRREKNVTLLMLAAATGQLEAARHLLAAGADRNARTARHKTVPIWLAGKGQHVGLVRLLLGKDPDDVSMKIRVDLGRQKATIYREGQPVDSAPISSGRKDFPTPKGTFVVTNKYKDWKSTIYDDAPMPYFMRLSCGDFGLHAGALPGYPASHGCIRLPYDKAKAFFARVEVGTVVEIVD